jgi:hypothetical protein
MTEAGTTRGKQETVSPAERRVGELVIEAGERLDALHDEHRDSWTDAAVIIGPPYTCGAICT